MLSFAIPGTVIGVSYVIAFNVPPIELTGTGIILVISFIFRNMPVGVRAGVASMAQIDRSLDESSLTLGAGSLATLRRVVLPLLKPAIVAALVYSFVRAMTAISAVIFLVSARYDMATTYIVGRVENNEYGVAIAYATVLIVVMLVVIGLMQLLVGSRASVAATPAAPASRHAHQHGATARRSDRRSRMTWSHPVQSRLGPLRGHQQGLPRRHHARGQRHLLRDRARHPRDPPRPLGLRQDHDAPPDRWPRDADGGPHPHRRRRRHAACPLPTATCRWSSSPTRSFRT